MNTNSLFADHHFRDSEQLYNWRIVSPYAYFYGSTALVGLGFLTAEVSRSQSDIPQSVGLLWMSDQPPENLYLTKHKSHKIHIHARRDPNP